MTALDSLRREFYRTRVGHKVSVNALDLGWLLDEHAALVAERDDLKTVLTGRDHATASARLVSRALQRISKTDELVNRLTDALRWYADDPSSQGDKARTALTNIKD